MEGVITFCSDSLSWCKRSMPTLVWGSQPMQEPLVVKETQTVAKVAHSLPGPPMGDLVRVGSPWLRLAGLSGAAAVALGAYGAHGNTLDRSSFNSLPNSYFPFILLAFAGSEKSPEMKAVFDTANRYHFYETS